MIHVGRCLHLSSENVTEYSVLVVVGGLDDVGGSVRTAVLVSSSVTAKRDKKT